jgi:hypothetical protein
MAKNHKHRAKKGARIECFSHCVNPENCNPGSHGNITKILVCSCGATQKVNINQGYVEIGPWQDNKDTD